MEFLDQTSLPENDDDWYDELHQKQPDKEAIEKAKASFLFYNCKNVGTTCLFTSD
jgi:hypothetical protein